MLNLDYKTHIEKIVNEDADAIAIRERSLFDELTRPLGSAIVLFGAGGLGKKVLSGLRTVGIYPVAFSDNNADLWGDTLEGVPVLSPIDAAQKHGRTAAFVVTIWRAGGGHRLEHTQKQLKDIGCLRVVSFAALFWKHADLFLPYYALGSPRLLIRQAELIRRAADLWSDDASRSEYLAQLRLRFSLDFHGLSSPVSHAQYFPDDLVQLNNDEMFVDCGAYDGDTIKELLTTQIPDFNGRIIAMEPDPENLVRLRDYVNALMPERRNLITIIPAAAGAHQKSVCFDATGTAAAGIDASGSFVVDCQKLDDILRDTDPTYLKMDIEGAELDALEGARQMIERSRPVLAISAYHQPDHLWKVPLWIHSLSQDYRLFLRPHNEEGWDLVCYAIPVQRLR